VAKDVRKERKERERERERDQLVCFVTRGHRHSQRGSWQEREREVRVLKRKLAKPKNNQKQYT